MEIEEAKAKYLNKVVRHMATGLTFKICSIERLGKWANYAIEASFEHLTLEDIPIGQPIGSGVQELEMHYEIES